MVVDNNIIFQIIRGIWLHTSYVCGKHFKVVVNILYSAPYYRQVCARHIPHHLCLNNYVSS